MTRPKKVIVKSDIEAKALTLMEAMTTWLNASTTAMKESREALDRARQQAEKSTREFNSFIQSLGPPANGIKGTAAEPEPSYPEAVDLSKLGA